MLILMKRAGLLTAGLILSAAAASAMETAENGMTLYTFDNDAGGMSACYDDCAANWPPYLGEAGATMAEEGWTLVERTDATMQWAYDGKPVYFFAGDAAAGDMNGDGVGGVWHVIDE